MRQFIDKVMWGLRLYDHYIDMETQQDILIHIDEDGFETEIRFNKDATEEDNDRIAREVIRTLCF